MARFSRIAFAACFLPLLFGCANKKIIGPNGDESIGQYAIPRAVIEATIQLKYNKKFLTDPKGLSTAPVSMSIKKFETKLIPSAYVDLEYHRDAFSDDKVTVELESFGFLKQVKVDVDDRSGDFITKIADIGIAAAKVATAFPATVFKIVGEDVEQEFTVLLDPYERNTQSYAFLAKHSVTIDVTDFAGAQSLQTDVNTLAIPDRCKGKICYPALIARKITFKTPIGSREEKVVVIPDPMNLVEIELARASLVKKTLTADFTNGMLTKISVDKPSEALAAVEIPLDILENIIKLPTELIQLKIDTSEKQAVSLEKQKALIEAQQSLIEAVEEAKQKEAERADDGTGSYDRS